MKYPVDLHIHSNFSPDGEMEPEDLFRLAKQLGLYAIALTDHNVVRGIPRALAAAKKYGLETFQGIEISSKYGKADVHILGYSDNFDLALLEKETEQTRQGYNQRSREIARKITETGIARIDFEKILEKFKDSYVAKVEVAKEIVKQKGIEYKEAIKLVERGGPGYVPYGDWAMSPHEAVELIHKAGGIAVMAHPGDFYTTRSSESPEAARKTLYTLIGELTELRMEGLEVYYSKHKPEWNQEFLELAQEKNLLISGGTDYHGPIKNPDFQMGDTGLSRQQFTLIRDKIINK